MCDFKTYFLKTLNILIFELAIQRLTKYNQNKVVRFLKHTVLYKFVLSLFFFAVIPVLALFYGRNNFLVLGFFKQMTNLNFRINILLDILVKQSMQASDLHKW